MNKIRKGNFGYIAYQRKASLLRTILFFALSLAIYGIGIYSTGSNKNLLTVVAVLGLLPACKSAVNVIMFFRASGCSDEAKHALENFDSSLGGLYDIYLTSFDKKSGKYQKNYPLSHLVVKGNVICALTEKAGCDTQAGEKHIVQMLAQDGYKNMTVKIFSERSKYIDRLGQLQNLKSEENKQTKGIYQMLLAIAL